MKFESRIASALLTIGVAFCQKPGDAGNVIADLESRAAASIASIPTPSSRAEIENSRRALKQKLAASLGLERLPTAKGSARIVKTTLRAGYRVDNLIFESLPATPVTANLYVPPRGNAKGPGVILLPPAAGKDDPQVQWLAHMFARRGAVALAFDPIGQGERGAVKPPGPELLLFGVSPAGIDEYEIRGALAVLASQDVDLSRIGLVSLGGSGFRALVTVVAEDRFSAAAIFGDFEDWGHAIRYASGHPLMQPRHALPGILTYANHEALLALAAPRRILLMDTASPASTVLPRLDEYGRSIYRGYGSEQNFSALPVRMEDPKEIARITGEWFADWLASPDTAPGAKPESFLPRAKDPDLLCLEQPLGGAAADPLSIWKGSRIAPPVPPGEPFLNAGKPIGEDQGLTIGLQIRLVQEVRFPSQGSIGLAATVYRPGIDGGAPESGILIAAGDRGRIALSGDPIVQEALRRNWQVWCVDPRGIGSSAARHPEWLAAISLMLGENFVWRQASDLRRVVAFAASATLTKRVALYANGSNVSLAALYATAAQGPSPLSFAILRGGYTSLPLGSDSVVPGAGSVAGTGLPLSGYFIFDALARGADLFPLFTGSRVPIWLVEPAGESGPYRSRTLDEVLRSDW